MMPMDLADADTVAGLARAVPGVAGLHSGMFGEAATYLPGRRVTGVRITDDHIEVHLVVEAGAPIRATAAEVRERVTNAFPESSSTSPSRTSRPRIPSPITSSIVSHH